MLARGGWRRQEALVDYLAQYGYFGLFLGSFLAATLVPLGSEVMLGAVLLAGYDPKIAISLATVGNVAGSLVNYGLGLWGGRALAARVLRLSPQDLEAAETRYGRYGPLSLLLAWLPLVGDPLTVIAGFFRTPLILFLVFVTLGKFGRYLVVGLSLL
jgi:membrane protein YqaA with SNARE-associated domain